MKLFAILFALLASWLHAGEMHRLGLPGQPEWDEFRDVPLEITPFDFVFDAEKNTNEWTIFLRQRDVKAPWSVRINGKAFTNLFLAEDDLVNAWIVPAGRLQNGTNTLTLVPSNEKDDIEVGALRIEKRTNFWSGPIDVEVNEAGKPSPCRLTVADANGSLSPMLVEGASIAARVGVAYLGTGRATARLPAGSDYTLYASRGFEFSVNTQRVSVSIGKAQKLKFELRREVKTPGMVSSDTHVHTFTYSRHGDATDLERAITLAGEGIELPIATDHNLIIDSATPAKTTGMDRYYTPVTGDEVTTSHAHFNIFPVSQNARVPNHRISDWPDLMKELRGTEGVKVVILNHPRNIHNNFQPFAATNFNAKTGQNLRGFEFSFDAVEVLNSSALQTDWMLSFTDWMALLNYGYKVTAVGSSDGHDVSRYIIGQGRSYVKCDDSDVSHIDVNKACESFLSGRVLVSMGLLTDIKVQDRFSVGDLATGLSDTINVTVNVQGPGWTAVDHIQLYANGTLVREDSFRPIYNPGEKKRVTWNLPKPPKDVYLVAIASGPAVSAPFWRIPKPYQPTSTTWKPRVIGATNPIWIDADGDGRFTPLRLQTASRN